MTEPTTFTERIQSETLPQLEQHAEIIQLLIEAYKQSPDDSEVRSQVSLDCLNKDLKAINVEVKRRCKNESQ